MSAPVLEKYGASNGLQSRSRLSGRGLQAGLLIGALSIFTAIILIYIPFSSIGWESMQVLWVGGGLFAALCFALGSSRTRTSSAQRAVFVLWGFLLISEAFFSRGGTIDSAFSGSFNIAAYGERIMWVVTFLVLIPLFLWSPLPVKRLFAGNYKWAALFGLVCLVSCAYAPRPFFAAAWAFKLVLVILLLHLCSSYLKDLHDVDSFLRITFWALAFLLVYWVIQGDGANSFFDEDGRLVRSNGLSATAGTLLMLSFTLYSSRRGWGMKKAAIVTGVGAFVLMVVAGGKAGIVAGLLSGILFFVIRKGFGSATAFVAGALVVGWLAITLSPMSRYLQNYIQSDDQATTLTGRTPLWEVAFPAILQKPILGHGYVASTFVSVQVSGVPWDAGHMHNGFLEVLYNNGLIGFVLVLAIHVVIVRNLLRVMRRVAPSDYLYQLGVGCFAVYINLLINGFANASFGGRAWHPFMVLLALVVISDKLVEAAYSDQRHVAPILVTQVARVEYPSGEKVIGV